MKKNKFLPMIIVWGAVLLYGLYEMIAEKNYSIFILVIIMSIVLFIAHKAKKSSRVVRDAVEPKECGVEKSSSANAAIVFGGSLGIKAWELRPDRIISGNSIIMLSDIIAITDGVPASSRQVGVINLWVREGTGSINVFSLRYPFDSLTDGKKSVAYIRRKSNDVFTKFNVLGERLDTEIHVRCHSCGEIYTFTPQEINEKLNRILEAKQQEKNAKLNSIGALSNVVGGTLTNANLNNMQAEANRQNALNARRNFVDYTKCLNCHSSDIERLTDEQWIEHLNQMKQKKSSYANINAPSAADELRKFKDLFDAGIINQEEFDAKKKQLLGL